MTNFQFYAALAMQNFRPSYACILVSARNAFGLMNSALRKTYIRPNNRCDLSDPRSGAVKRAVVLCAGLCLNLFGSFLLLRAKGRRKLSQPSLPQLRNKMASGGVCFDFLA